MEEHIRKAIQILYSYAFLLGLALIGLSFFRDPSPQQESYLTFYTDSILSESGNWLGYILSLVLAGGLLYSLIGRIKGAVKGDRGLQADSTERVNSKYSRLRQGLINLVKLVIPVSLNLILFSYIVGHINFINRNRLIDTTLASVDHWLTGAYLFVSLQNLKLPLWFVKGVILSFANLPLFMVFCAAVAYLKDKLVFSKYAVAFFTSIVLMVPIWLSVPVMSPQDRFIDNVYNLADPPRISSALNHYEPMHPVKSFLKQMRLSKVGLVDMPTTTFPSSHAAWATLVLIYLFEASSIAGILMAPFLILSTFGTFYLAQHYFVDAPTGIIIGLLSVLISSGFFRKWEADR